MPKMELDLDPVTHITTDAIGQPGSRVFYIQGIQGDQVITLLVEKAQILSLSAGIVQFFAEINAQYPDLSDANADFEEDSMRIEPPVEPLFRVGELGLGYEAERDLMVLLAREILLENQEPEDASVVRFWCTRQQISAFGRWAQKMVSQGRPICPQCGEPMAPEGHFCPKKNGHKH